MTALDLKKPAFLLFTNNKNAGFVAFIVYWGNGYYLSAIGVYSLRPSTFL